MAERLFVVGLSWRTAPVALREKLAFSDAELAAELNALLRCESISEGLILSTCNRVEVYGFGDESAAVAEARAFLGRSRNVPNQDIESVLYEQVGDDAVQHAYRVASALDSMVVGESQITGQLKAAYGHAVQANTVGQTLGRCMENAFGVAKRVRTDTGISKGSANVSSVAVELAKRVFGDLNGKNVLIIGAGKMSALAARHLRSNGASRLWVLNRSLDRAEKLATEIDGTARPFSELEPMLTEADVVITSTGSPKPILTKKIMKRTAKARRYKPQIVVDIAVPRDVEESVSKLDGLYVFDVDDLRKVVEENLLERTREAEPAEALVKEEVATFSSWLRSKRAVPTIRSLREHFLLIASTEVERAISALSADSSVEDRDEAMRRMARLIANKLLHTPLTALKSGGETELDALVASTHRLFGLDSAKVVKKDEKVPVETNPLAKTEKERGSR